LLEARGRIGGGGPLGLDRGGRSTTASTETTSSGEISGASDTLPGSGSKASSSGSTVAVARGLAGGSGALVGSRAETSSAIEPTETTGDDSGGGEEGEDETEGELGGSAEWSVLSSSKTMSGILAASGASGGFTTCGPDAGGGGGDDATRLVGEVAGGDGESGRAPSLGATDAGCGEGRTESLAPSRAAVLLGGGADLAESGGAETGGSLRGGDGTSGHGDSGSGDESIGMSTESGGGTICGSRAAGWSGVQLSSSGRIGTLPVGRGNPLGGARPGAVSRRADRAAALAWVMAGTSI